MTSTAEQRAAGDGVEAAERLTVRFLLTMAIAMVRTNRRGARAFLVVGVAVTGLLLSFASINAMQTMMSQSARDIISGDVSGFARGYEFSMLNPQSDVVRYLSDDDALLTSLRAQPDVASVRPRLTAGAQLSTATAETGIVIAGSDFAAERYELDSGQAPHGARQICINTDQRDQLGLRVGSRVALRVAGAPTATASVSARVTCVYDNARFGLFRSTTAVMDVAGMQSILDRPGALTQVLVTLRPGIDASDAADELAAAAPGVRFTTAETTARLIFTILRAQQVVMWVLVLVTSLVCAALIASVVAFTLRRDRGQIATLRAMGFGPGAIRAVYTMRFAIVGLGMILAATLLSIIGVVVTGLIGIPIGGGEQLFGDSTLRPRLTGADVVLTGLLLLVALVCATLVASGPLLRKSPIELAADA